MMNLTAWQLWEVATGEPAEGARTLEIQRVLEDAIDLPGGATHPGLLHLYVHLMEMSAHPERALGAADTLRTLVPDAGHLLHMPTHIDVLCGDYARVVTGNTAAIAADDRYAEHAGDVGFYALYRAHDHHFRIYGAMFAAQEQVALDAAAALEAMLPETLLRVESPPMADWLEGFVPMRLHVLIRFGRWDALIATPLPADPELYCTTTAMTHYARGVALAATGQVAEAHAEHERFVAAVERVPESRYLFNNTCRDILAVAGAMLEGELAYREERFEAAFAALRRAIELDDTLPYDEPWGWMQPTRHAYGALLLEQGEVELAEAVYAADLGLDATLGRACQHPGNVWSLHGYQECLARLGKDDAARIVAQQLELAAARRTSRSARPAPAGCRSPNRRGSAARSRPARRAAGSDRRRRARSSPPVGRPRGNPPPSAARQGFRSAVPQTKRTGQVTAAGSSGQCSRSASSIIGPTAGQSAAPRMRCAISSGGMCS